MVRKKQTKRKDYRAQLDIDISFLPANEERETRKTINDYVSTSVNSGLIPESMVGIVEDYLNLRIESLRSTSTSDNIFSGDWVDRIVELTDPGKLTRYVPPQSTSSLIDMQTGAFLVGGVSPILFNTMGTGASYSTSLGDFLKENKDTLIAETMIEVIALILILLPGGGAAKKTGKEIAEKALKNKKIVELLWELVNALLEYRSKTKGASLDKIRKILENLVKELKNGKILDNLLDDFIKGLTGWQIFLLILEIILIFTPLGWGKKVTEILVWIAGITYHIHHKHAEWEKKKKG